MRITHSSGAVWEERVGYKRAVRIGNLIEVSGTTAVINGQVVGAGSGYEQAVCIFKIITEAIEALGGSRKDVIRTRMYVTDISIWEEVGRAHAAFFGNHPPAATMVEVSALIDPELMVEIEATALIAE